MASLSKEDILQEKKTTDPNSIISLLSFTHKALSNVSCLSEFKKLEKLDLTFNNLTSLQGLESCVNLKWLVVEQNKLQTLKGIESLTNLTVFKAGKNVLKSMDEVKNLVKLRALILNDNEIASISGLDQLTELNTLVLSRNPISKMGNALAKLKSIVKVSLSNCQLEAIDSSIKACTKLEQLRLSHNDIKSLPAELGDNKKLQILDVGNNMLSRWSDLEALSSIPNLKDLNLRGNPISEKAKLLKKINKLVPRLQIFNSNRMDRLNHDGYNKKVGHAADVANDVGPPTKKEGDSGDRSMDVDSDKHVNQHVLNKGHKSERIRGLQENGSTTKEEKFGKTFKEGANSANVANEDGYDKRDYLKKQKDSKERVGIEGEKVDTYEEIQLKNIKKRKENRVEEEVPSQESDRSKTDKKSKRKAEKAGVDVIDDKERSFMEVMAYSASDNIISDDIKRKDRSVRNMDSIGAVVTYPAKKKKAKGVKTSAFELIESAPEVGLGGPSAWDM